MILLNVLIDIKFNERGTKTMKTMLLDELLFKLHFGTKLNLYENEIMEFDCKKKIIISCVWNGDNLDEDILQRKVMSYSIEDNAFNIRLVKEREE